MSLMIGLALSVTLQQRGGGGVPTPVVNFTVNPNLRSLKAFGTTVGQFSSDSTDTTYTMLDDAGGMFSIGGSRLRLEKLPGNVGTVYNIQVRATAPGKAASTVDIALTVTETYTNGLVARWNALDLANLWQDNTGTTPVTADGQPVGRWLDSISGWEFGQATLANRPLYKTGIQNGRAGVLFDGTNDFMQAVTADLINFFGTKFNGKEWTIMFVGTPTDNTNNREILSWGTTTAMNLMFRHNTGIGLYGYLSAGGGTDNVASLEASPANSPLVWSASANGAPDGTIIQLVQNGVHNISTASGDSEWVVNSTAAAAAIAPTVCTLGCRSATSSRIFFKGYVFEILIYNRKMGAMEAEYIQSQLAAEWGFTVGQTYTFLDRTGYELWWEDDFDTDIRTPLGQDNNPTGWVDAYTQSGFRSAYGSTGALQGETAFMPDMRNPVFADNGVNNRWLEDSYLVMQSCDTPAALLANCQNKPYLGYAQITHGWKEQTFGLIEVMAKMPTPKGGPFPAAWMMGACAHWPPEIDIHEHFKGSGQIRTALHTDPYYPSPGGSTGKSQTGISTNKAIVDQTDTNDHTFAIIYDETGIYNYFDGRYIGKMPPLNGVRNMSIATGGTGLTDGTYTLYATGSAQAIASLVVSGGVATSVTVTKSGAGFSSDPVWYTNAGQTILLTTTLPGVTFNHTYGPDPDLPNQFHEPMYILLNLAIGALGGTYNTSTPHPIVKWDRVRWYRKVRPTPAKITSGVDPTFDSAVDAAVTPIITAYSSGGETLSTTKQNAVALLVRKMMGWQLRFDTVPTGGLTFDWDTTKLSLWDAYDLLYIPALANVRFNSKINWKSPGQTLSEVGSGIGFTPGQSLTLPGTGGVYLTSGQAPVQFNGQDAGFSVFLRGPVTNSSMGALMGYSSTGYWAASTTAWTSRMGTSSGPTAPLVRDLNNPLGAGFYSHTRGYRPTVSMFRDGESVFGGYISGNAQSSVGGTFKIGSYDGSTAGAAFEFSMAGVGRRTMQEENYKMNEILREFLTTIGAL